MNEEQRFQRLPSSTNAVESHNWLSKTGRPEILCIAMLTTYKVDMAWHWSTCSKGEHPNWLSVQQFEEATEAREDR
jgi:hypothetical protein